MLDSKEQVLTLNYIIFKRVVKGAYFYIKFSRHKLPSKKQIVDGSMRSHLNAAGVWSVPERSIFPHTTHIPSFPTEHSGVCVCAR